MISEATIRAKIERNRTLPTEPTMAFLMDYRDLVISIADGEVEGDVRRLCRILAHAELDLAMERANAERPKGGK